VEFKNGKQVTSCDVEELELFIEEDPIRIAA
jgi:hypothetical protein